LEQAELTGAFDRRAIEEQLTDHPTRRGGAALRAVLAEHAIGGGGVTRSELEERFLACASAPAFPARS
jgi:hypothetical protein